MKTAFALSTLACSVIVSGCGGGGGSSPDTPPTNVATSVEIQGEVVKGPLSEAKVDLYAITPAGTQGALLQTVRTDKKGHYVATINGYSGVLLSAATVVSGETKMYDEATGQTISPAAGFILRASFSVQGGKSYGVQINPFTDLAVAAASSKSGGLNAGNVAQANKDIAESLTFDPLSTPSNVDSTGKAPTNAAAAALYALSQMAASGDLGCTGDQAAKVLCVTKTLSEKGLVNPGVKAALQSRLDVVLDNANLPSLKITEPSGTPVTVASLLGQTQAFIGTLRSNAKALDATDLSLQTELQKVADDLKGRTVPITSVNIDAVNVARQGAQFWNDVVKTDAAPFVASRGNCGFYSDTGYSVLATSKADAKYVACGTTPEPLFLGNCFEVGVPCRKVATVRVRLHPDLSDGTRFTVYTKTREQLMGRTSSALPVTLNNISRVEFGAAFPGNAATLVTQRDAAGKLTGLNLTGELSPAYTLNSGRYQFDPAVSRYVYIQPSITVLGDKQNVALSAVVSKLGELDQLAISGSIELVKGGLPESRIELADGSYMRGKPDGTGSYSAHDGNQEMLLKLKTGAAASAFTGDLKLSAFKADASGGSYIPTQVSFVGGVQRNGVNFLEGTVLVEVLGYPLFNQSLPVSPSNAETVRVSFGGKVSIPTRPTLKISLSSVQVLDGVQLPTDKTEFSGQYSQGSVTINIAGARTLLGRTTTLQSTEGVKLVVDSSKTIYPLTNNGQTMGQYSTTTSRVDYTDGSYEQF